MNLDDCIAMVGGGRYSAGLSCDYDSGVFLVRVDGQRWLIDAGAGYDSSALHSMIRTELAGEALDGVALTHSHADHAGGARDLALEFGCGVFASGDASRRMASRDVAEVAVDSAIRAGIYPADYRFGWFEPNNLPLGTANLVSGEGEGLMAVPTPGHSHDHVCYILDVGGKRYAFTGDLVFARGRVALLGSADSDIGELNRSIQSLASLNPDAILPGHGTVVMNGAQWHLDAALHAFRNGQIPAGLV